MIFGRRKPKALIAFYVDNRGKHRWRIMAKNGEIVAASSQGFVSLSKARQNLSVTKGALRGYSRK